MCAVRSRRSDRRGDDENQHVRRQRIHCGDRTLVELQKLISPFEFVLACWPFETWKFYRHLPAGTRCSWSIEHFRLLSVDPSLQNNNVMIFIFFFFWKMDRTDFFFFTHVQRNIRGTYAEQSLVWFCSLARKIQTNYLWELLFIGVFFQIFSFSQFCPLHRIPSSKFIIIIPNNRIINNLIKDGWHGCSNRTCIRRHTTNRTQEPYLGIIHFHFQREHITT